MTENILSDQKQIYCGPHQTLNFDSARQSSIEALHSERGTPSLHGKGDEEDRLNEVAASQNSKFDAGHSKIKYISRVPYHEISLFLTISFNFQSH